MDRHLLAAYSRRTRGDHMLLAQWSAGKDSVIDWEVWGRGRWRQQVLLCGAY